MICPNRSPIHTKLFHENGFHIIILCAEDLFQCVSQSITQKSWSHILSSKQQKIVMSICTAILFCFLMNQAVFKLHLQAWTDMPNLRCLVTGFSPQRPGVSCEVAHVKFLVDKTEMGHLLPCQDYNTTAPTHHQWLVQ